MQVFGYVRVSVKGDGLSQRGQINKMQYEIDRWVEDLEVKGTIPVLEREGMRELMSVIKQGDVLIVSELSRIGRNQLDALQTIKTLVDRGVILRIAQLPSLEPNTPMGNMMISVMTAMAEMELTLRRERCQAGVDRAKLKGKYKGRPLGAKAKVKSTLQIKMDEAIDKGLNSASIARLIGCHVNSVYKRRRELDREREEARIIGRKYLN